jgi:hypothetical protein
MNGRALAAVRIGSRIAPLCERWGLVHVAFLADLRGRMAVMFDWFWSYLIATAACG